MRPSIVTRVVVVHAVLIGAILALPDSGFAQDVIVSGTVSDTTGAVLPGAVVTALHEASGNTFESVDLRSQRRFRLGGRASIDGLLEVFNLFNHENYGSYTTAESNANYGMPSQNTNVAYQPRMLQFGFRATF
jgi:hypothetical protein